MTKPQFNGQISLGNVLSIIVLITGLLGSWFALQADVGNLRSDHEKLVASTSASFNDHEKRIRDVERISTTQSADFRAMNSTLRDIKAQQQENNQLLRQLLSRRIQ